MHPVLHPVRPAFRAIAATVVPEAAAFDADDWEELERIIEDALAARPRKLRRQLVALIRVIQLRPLLRYGRTFTALDADRRTRVLRRFESSRLLLLRRGFWGLRTLVFMGYYARPAAAAVIGYRADPRGWDARADAAGPDAPGARAGDRTSPAAQADPAAPAVARDAQGAP
ncbi:MAG TPA: hypothetical protein VF158_06785 [Longimicrobiales bacterium]